MPEHRSDVGGKPPGSPRPVTPLGLAAQLLSDLERRLTLLPGMTEDDSADLRRVCELVGGLEEYVARCTSPHSAALAALETRTRAEDWRARSERSGAHLEQEMLSGRVEGQLLRFLVQLSGARRILEIGMFTGYSALAMAEALPGDGQVVACELDPATADLARECFATSSAGGRIRVEVGPALASLDRLSRAGERFDLVFVDADKTEYADYVDAIIGCGLLAPAGVVCVDNTLLQGEPWLGGKVSANGRAIAEFNDRIAADPRVEQVLVPLRDGVTLIRAAGL